MEKPRVNTQANEAIFKATFELAAVGIAHVAPDGQFLRINQKFCEIVGYDQNEMMALSFQAITHPDDLDSDLAQVQHVLAGEGETYTLEKRYFRKDGSIVWVDLTVSLVRDENGEPQYLIAVVADISAQKLAEVALRESEARYRGLVEQAQDGIVVLQDERVVFASPRLAQMTDRSVDDLVGTKFQDHIPPDQLPTVGRAYRNRMEGGDAPAVYESAILRRDGSRLEVEFNGGITTFQGRPANLVIVRDITVRKGIEAQLREHQEKLAGILRSLPDPITMIDREHKVIWANELAIQAFGPEFIGERCHRALRGCDDVCESCIVKSAFEDGGVHQETATYTLSDGQKRNLWCTASLATIDAQGEPAVVVVVYRDVTDKQRLQEDYDRILNLSGDLICVAGLDGYFKYLNPAWEKILGYKREEMLGRPFLDFIHPADHGKNLDEVEKLSFGLVTTDFENRYIHKDGTIRHISWVASPVPEEELLYCIGRDVTDSRIAELQIQDHRLRLRRLAAELTMVEERERRRLAADLHDQVGQVLALARIRLASAQKASADPDLSQSLREISQSLLQAAADTKTLVSDLSSPAMNELGLLPAVSEWMEEKLVGTYGLKAELVNDLPSGRIHGLGEDERAVLFRSIRELLTNVVKHADASQVRVRFSEAGSWCQIIVEDDGIGLFSAELDDLPGRSRGFGLFSIRERMADLGGSLEIHSKPGAGFQAILNIPMRSPVTLEEGSSS